jgi:membrane protein involved in colicin uptake
MRRIGIIAILFGALIWGSTGAAVAAAPTSAGGKSAIAARSDLCR